MPQTNSPPPSPSSSSPPPRLAYISAGALCRGGRGGRRIDRIHGDHVTAHRRLVGVKLLGEAARAVLARLARPVSARPAVRLQARADGVRVCVRLWVLVQRAGHWAEASSPQPPLPRLHNRNPPPKKKQRHHFLQCGHRRTSESTGRIRSSGSSKASSSASSAPSMSSAASFQSVLRVLPCPAVGAVTRGAQRGGRVQAEPGVRLAPSQPTREWRHNSTRCGRGLVRLHRFNRRRCADLPLGLPGNHGAVRSLDGVDKPAEQKPLRKGQRRVIVGARRQHQRSAWLEEGHESQG